MHHERPYVIVTAGFEPVRDIVARVCPVGYTPKRVIDQKYAKRDIDPYALLMKGESFMWCLDLETAADRRKVVEDIHAVGEDLDYEIILVANEEHKFKSRPKLAEGFDALYWDGPDRGSVPELFDYIDRPVAPQVPARAEKPVTEQRRRA